MRLRDMIRLELRAVGLTSEPAQPMPTDLDAEGEVLSAVLNGDVTCADLAPLEASDFYATIHGAIWRAACVVAPGDLEGIYSHLQAGGWIGALDQELEQLALTQPWRCRVVLREQADRIRELARRRTLIAQLQRIESDMRTHRLTAPEACKKLRGVSE